MADKKQRTFVSAEHRANYLAALEAEKAGYQLRKLSDRVKAVDDEIKACKGAPVVTAADAAEADE